MKTKQNENKVEPILYAIQWRNEKIIDNEFVFDSFDDANEYLEYLETTVVGGLVPLYKDVKEGSVYKFSCCAIQWSGENKLDAEFVFDSFEEAKSYLSHNCNNQIIPLYRSILDSFSNLEK